MLLCGKALGFFDSIEEAAATMATTGKQLFYKEKTPVYEKQYGIFLELYEHLKQTFKHSLDE